MNRRGFIRRVLGAVAAGAVLDVDCLLWVPGAKTIFLPTLEPVRCHTLITPAWIARDVAQAFKNQLVFLKVH
jgi:hypothetical protein